MLALIVLLAAIVYLSIGIVRFKRRADAVSILTGTAMAPLAGLGIILTRVLLWPLFGERSARRRAPTGAERL